MKTSITYPLLLCLIGAHLVAQECPPPAAEQRDLVILPDTASDESFDLIGKLAVNNIQINALERLLSSEATPVLVELSIWKRFAKDVSKTPRTWLDEKKYYFYTFETYLLCIPHAWKAHVANSGFHLEKFKRVEHPLELIPGRMEQAKPFIKTLLLLFHLYASLVKTLRTLLVPNPFAWNIVLEGHGGPLLGSYQSRVAGIPFREFKKLLTFLKTEITTNIFLYTTCYAGSQWLLKAYTTKNRPDIYPFPIILTGISDAPVYGYTSRSRGTIMGGGIYKEFFQKIKTIPLCKKNRQPLGIIAGILLQALRFNRPQNRYALTTTNNILQIRWPDEKQFHPIELDKIIEVEPKHKEPTIEVKADTLLINTPVLHKTIRLTRKGQAIISITPQKWQYIAAIRITGTPSHEEAIKQLFDALRTVRKLKSAKGFLINQLQDASGRVIARTVLAVIRERTAATLFIKRKTELFYTVGTHGYLLKKGEEKPIELSPRQTKWYLGTYAKEKKRLLA